jgi:hypothetical protein
LVNAKQVTVQEIIIDTGGILKKNRSVQNDYEQRRRLIEELDLKIERDSLRRRIIMIYEGKK